MAAVPLEAGEEAAQALVAAGSASKSSAGGPRADDALGHEDDAVARASRAKAISWVTTSIVMPSSAS